MPNEIRLEGCKPTTLLAYLKALGVFRLVAEQADQEIRARWQDEQLVIQTDVTQKELCQFFLEQYKPAPIMVPWSGKDFFEVDAQGDAGPFSKAPTGSTIVEAFLAAGDPRLEPYRNAIAVVLETIDEMGIEDADLKSSATGGRETKSTFVNQLRSRLPEESLQFLDAALLARSDRAVMNSLLGSGGGNDGRLDFGSNFMQSLWWVLPSFEAQRDLRGWRQEFDPQAALRHALFASDKETRVGIKDDTPGLFHPGGVGGPNADRGFEADAVRNPWDFVLGMEGVFLLAGSISRRRRADWEDKRASFPFTASVTSSREGISLDETSEANSTNREVWMPVWSHHAAYPEIEQLFHEGRAEVGTRSATSGTDFGRAVSTLGVDRGIDGFYRYAIVQGRVGGPNYLSGTLVDFYSVPDRPRQEVRLLDQIDGWLRRLRWIVNNDSEAKRFGRHLRDVESSIDDLTRRGGQDRLIAVLRALGRAEQSFARAHAGTDMTPLTSLKPDWLPRSYDGSSEFRLAASVASIFHSQVGPIRRHLEPVDWTDDQPWVNNWTADESASVTWTEGSLSDNLQNLLERRQLLYHKQDLEVLPIAGHLTVPLADVSSYLQGTLDEEKIQDLLWAFATLRWDQFSWEEHAPSKWFALPQEDALPLSRLYALVKLLYLPGSLRPASSGSWEMAYESARSAGSIHVPPVPKVLKHLRAHRIQEATAEAYHRLRGSGVTPSIDVRGTDQAPDFLLGTTTVTRLVGALIFPIHRGSDGVGKLANRILKPPSDILESSEEVVSNHGS